MDFPVPTASFTRCDERSAVVVVDMTDLLRTTEEHLAMSREPRILNTRTYKVPVQVDNRHMKADIVRSDTVIGSFGKVERVTLMLPDGHVVLLGLDGARELTAKQAVWAIRYDKPIRYGY